MNFKKLFEKSFLTAKNLLNSPRLLAWHSGLNQNSRGQLPWTCACDSRSPKRATAKNRTTQPRNTKIGTNSK